MFSEINELIDVNFLTQCMARSKRSKLLSFCGIYIDIYHGILLSHKKNPEILPFAATWMDLEGIMLSETSQTETDKHYMISLLCGI